MTSRSRTLQRWTVLLSLMLLTLVSGMAYLLWQDAQGLRHDYQVSAEPSSVRIQREGFADMVMARDRQYWNIESPCAMPVNRQRLQPLLDALTSDSVTYPASEVDLLSAGLTTPQATVYLDELDYRIGDTDLSGERRYVQRGKRVAFIPEWVLSLVNGGITAFAQLNLFADTLSSISVTAGNGDITEYSTAEALDLWQHLSAQQIARWPLEDASETPSYRVMATSTAQSSQVFEVHETEGFTAMRLADSECAYILAADDLPD